MGQTITTEEKFGIIRQLLEGERTVDICLNVRIAHHSVHTIRVNADRIKESAKS